MRDDDMDGQEVASGRFTDDLPQQIVAFVDGKWFVAMMAVLTVFALWGDDLRLSAFEKKHDEYFFALFTLALVMFLAEFTLNTIAKADYKWSFFFWLDLVAAISIVPDVEWIREFAGEITSGDSVAAPGSGSMSNSVQSTRTARIVRLVRLIRLIRIMKLYSFYRKASNADGEEKLRTQALAAQNAKQAALKRVEASRLGKVLAEMTTRRVVVIVLVLLTCLPVLQHVDTDTSKQFGLSQIFWYGLSDCSEADKFYCDEHLSKVQWISPRGWKNMIVLYSHVNKDHAYSGTKNDLLGLPYGDTLLWLHAPNRLHSGTVESIDGMDSDVGPWAPDPNCSGATVDDSCPYRSSELEFIIYQPFECAPEVGCSEVRAFARFEKKERSIVEALYRMLTTICVCVLLGSMSIQFQNDTQSLVIAPIEKMVNIIKQLAEDPLRKPDLANFEDTESPVKASGKAQKGPQLETTMLENTILKIGGLLQVGFGEAGAQIIGKNMSSGDGELNIMMPGTRITSIFGFVDIRRFTDTTECLQEEVMVFVNTIGCILHQCAHRWGGVANKNIGDAFLMLWKLPEPNTRGKTHGVDVATRTADLANRALFSFIKFSMECRRSERIKSYSSHPKIISRFGDNYTVNFGLGLHSGWAIEGPIGSDYKVDASYLSPHVNLTMNLEAATKVYQVPLLMSEKFYNMLSVRTKERIRKVDIIMFGHSAQGIYAVPMNAAVVEAPIGHICGEIIKLEGLDVEASMVEEDGAEYLFIVDQDMTQIQKGLPEDGFSQFRTALSHYISGNWEEAKTFLATALEIDPEDGPSLALWTFLDGYDFVAPVDWQGWRSLDV